MPQKAKPIFDPKAGKNESRLHIWSPELVKKAILDNDSKFIPLVNPRSLVITGADHFVFVRMDGLDGLGPMLLPGPIAEANEIITNPSGCLGEIQYRWALRLETVRYLEWFYNEIARGKWISYVIEEFTVGKLQTQFQLYMLTIDRGKS